MKNNTKIMSWFQTAKAGDSTIYHNGMTVNDRVQSGYVSAEVMEARRLYDIGLIDLTQKRLDPHGYKFSRFDYIATKRKHPAVIYDEHTFSACGLTLDSLVA